jgi:putative radical SAM enzyme (TIGR03279 family)
MPGKGLRIVEVLAGSPAEEIGLEAGDRILTANGHEIPDELALQFHLSEDFVDLLVKKTSGADEHIEADLSQSTSLGVKVEDFRTRTCNNACLFCFIDQLPPGIRPGLQIKDDDYRLSFLHGNYITLTNLPEKELDRIIKHRLSPLYVSVHATDQDVRTRMLGRSKVDDLDRKLDKLIRGRIQVHAQIVLMPGINDGENLTKTVFDLYKLFPGIQSIAVVPLGISDHGTIKDRFAPVTPDFSSALIRQALPWQEQFRAETGKTFIYLADEFYIQSGASLPDSRHYDDFAQIEDGVGMVRNFLDEFKVELGRHRKSLPGLSGTLATGKLFFPTLQDCMDQFNRKFGSSLRVCSVENRFMGRSITVAGLLAGQDFLAALQGKNLGNFLVIPQEAVSRVGGILVDDIFPLDLSQRLGKPVYSGGRTVHDLFNLLAKIRHPKGGKRLKPRKGATEQPWVR